MSSELLEELIFNDNSIQLNCVKFDEDKYLLDINSNFVIEELDEYNKMVIIGIYDKRSNKIYKLSENNRKYANELGIEIDDVGALDKPLIDLMQYKHTNSKMYFIDTINKFIFDYINDELVAIGKLNNKEIYKLDKDDIEYINILGIKIKDQNALENINIIKYKHIDDNIYYIDLDHKFVYDKTDDDFIAIGKLEKDKNIYKLKDSEKKYLIKLGIKVDDSKSKYKFDLIHYKDNIYIEKNNLFVCEINDIKILPYKVIGYFKQNEILPLNESIKTEIDNYTFLIY